MEKKVYITEEEREKCRRVIDAFAELYEMEDEDMLVVDAGRYGFVKLQCYTPSYGFEELDTYTDSHSLFEGLWDEWLSLNLFLIAVGDYPPAIQKKCIELGLIEDRKKRFTKADYIRKGAALIVLAAFLAFVARQFNGADSFWEGFSISYLIWLIIDWYDALILDCIWFCHSNKVRIHGTEDMAEYKDYLFHIRQSCIGMLLGLPACLLAGLLVMIF